MKKVVSTLAILVLAVTMSFAVAKKEKKAESKEAECNKACQSAFVKCEKEAKKDKAKKAACVTEKKDCKAKCESAEKETK